jgi:hypothetical protein
MEHERPEPARGFKGSPIARCGARSINGGAYRHPGEAVTSVNALTMRKTWTSSSCTKWAASAALLALILITGVDAWDAVQSPHQYPFGAEGPAANLWAYKTQRHYLAASALSVAAYGLAIAGVWIHPAQRLLRRLCFVPLLAIAALTAYDWIALFE